MSRLFSAFAGTFTWVFDTLFGTVRPFLSPFLDDRSTPGIETLLAASPSATILPSGPLREGLFSGGWTPLESPAVTSAPKANVWLPAIADVLHTRGLLQTASKRRLPIELINTILDYAEYWPHVSVSKKRRIVARGSSSNEDVLVIRTPPICALASAGCEDDSRGLPEPSLLHPARKVVFRICSHDQGFSEEEPGTQNTYQPSHTWFDAEIDEEFGPLEDDEPLSRIPWELSSTRFLHERPQYWLPRRSGEEDKAILSNEIRELQQSRDIHNKEENQTEIHQSSRDLPTADDQPKTSGNPEHPEHPKPRIFSHEWFGDHKYQVQYNVQAKSEMTEHTITWRYTDNTQEDSPEAAELRRIGRGEASANGSFVRCLRLGDCVSLWAKARHPRWVNYVDSATVEVYFAI